MSSLRGFTAAGAPTSVLSSFDLPLFDIGVNLLDNMYDGEYNGKQRHVEDRISVLQRAKSMGVQSVICTAGSVQESIDTLKLVREYRALEDSTLPELYCTVGIYWQTGSANL